MIPKQLAIVASGAGAKVFAEKARQINRKESKAKIEAEEAAKKFADIAVHISMEVGEEDRLFGSVTSADIADQLKVQGIDVDKRKILLDEPLKQLGVYNVPIKLFRGVEPKIKVWVEKKV